MLKQIRYDCDGVRLTGYLALPAGSQRAPGIIVAHEGIGMNSHIKNRTLALAELGYAALAIDLYGAEELRLEDARVHSTKVMSTPGLMASRALAGLEQLNSEPRVDPQRIAAIGFCQGGITIMELARAGAPLKAVVGFHPGLRRPEGSPDGPVAAKVLMMVGHSDPVVTEADRTAFMEDMHRSGADWQLHVFGGVGHSFTNPDVGQFGMHGFAYDEIAHNRSWALMRGLLDEVFD